MRTEIQELSVLSFITKRMAKEPFMILFLGTNQMS